MRNFLLITLLITATGLNAQCWETVSVGERHVAGIQNNGTLWGWGHNGDTGKVGNGLTVTVATPEQIGSATDWKEVHAGRYHSLGIKDNGTLWGWGSNLSGALGAGNAELFSLIPIQIGTTTWKMVRAGSAQSVGIKNDGTLWGWGDNEKATVGDGTFINRSTPVLINNSTNWKMVSSNTARNIALKEDGTLWAWGMNSPSLGFSAADPVGGQSYVTVPSQVGLDNDWKSVVAGSGYFLALKINNTLWAWGGGGNGCLGNGSTTGVPWPTQIGTATDWKMVEADVHSSFGIKMDGTLWAWGQNTLGNLGDGTQNDLLVPTQISTSSDWKTVATSYNSTTALKADGSLYSWGSNAFGTLGDGTFVNQLSPLLINSCSLGTEDFGKVYDIILYPNPAHDRVNIRFETDAPTSQVEVYDLTGRLISSFESTATQGVLELDLAPMATGVYVVVLRQGTQILMQRKLQVY